MGRTRVARLREFMAGNGGRTIPLSEQVRDDVESLLRDYSNLTDKGGPFGEIGLSPYLRALLRLPAHEPLDGAGPAKMASAVAGV